MKYFKYTLVLLMFVSSKMMGQTSTENYVKKTAYQVETTTGTVDENEKIESISYYDGLGRPMQSVGVHAGGDLLKNNIINWESSWTLGSGSAPFFNKIGSTSENERVLGTDPYDNSSILWECGNDSSNNADGGWNTNYIPIDNTIGYRYTVWVKRTGSQNGKTYHGTQNVNNLSGSANTNPYFWNGDTPNLNQWYLLVGVIHPYTYSGGYSGISGVYDTNGNKVISGTDFKWDSATTTSRFRSYLYYSTNTSVRQYFYDPILQKLDGNEASIAALMEGHTGQDIVSHVDYDGFGRQAKDYLPYVISGNSGEYRTNALTATDSYYLANYSADLNVSTPNPYSEKAFEASPLNRVLQQAAPGEDWAIGEGNEVEFAYDTNTDTEVKRYDVTLTFANNTYSPVVPISSSSAYADGELTKTITKDENHDGTITKDRTTEEFKDKGGRVVLKRSYNNENEHDTYYIYDDYGNLTFVIPPLVDTGSSITTTILNDLCYQYKYDSRNRLVEKKLPGKGWESIVYNKIDEPILTQDPNLEGDDQWLFTKFDVFGRVAYTGLMSSASGRTSMQSTVDGVTSQYETKSVGSFSEDGLSVYYNNVAYPTSLSAITELHTVNYYDSYSGIGTLPGGLGTSITTYYGLSSWSNIKSLPTVNKTRVLETSSNKWITTVTYYDEKSRPIYVYVDNPYLGTIDIEEIKYNFVGKVLETKSRHTKSGQSTITTYDNFKYDHMGRLVSQKQKVDANADEVIVQNNYDVIGQLTSKGVGGKTTQVRLQTVDYTHNIRGWLKGINEVADLGTSDLFAFKINYNTTSHSGTELYNGNIAETEWKTANDNALRWYRYNYDDLNRITSAIGSSSNYNLTDVDYDPNGNITSLIRQGVRTMSGGVVTSYGEMDDLTYTYQANSNKLLKVADASTLDQYGFKDDAVNGASDTADDYAYDDNGNMIKDLNKEIGTSSLNGITYNHLNLPMEVKFNNSSTQKINYIYDALGTKLEKKVTEGSTITKTFYAGNYVYEKVGSASDVLKFFNHPEGYAEPDGSSWDYVYQYKDHLGNIRLNYSDLDDNGSINASTEILEENNYYPFGLKHKGYNNDIVGGADHPYGYNGVEESNDPFGLDMLEMDLRQYDPAIARWTTMDPVVQHSYSPYEGFNSNPIMFKDPSGAYGMTGGWNISMLAGVMDAAKEKELNKLAAASGGSGSSSGSGNGTSPEAQAIMKEFKAASTRFDDVGKNKDWRMTLFEGYKDITTGAQDGLQDKIENTAERLSNITSLAYHKKQFSNAAENAENFLNGFINSGEDNITLFAMKGIYNNVSNMTLYDLSYSAGYAAPGIAASFVGGYAMTALKVASGEALFQSASFGYRSSKFGRYHPIHYSDGFKGSLNRGPFRTGWGWETGKGDVFRTSLPGKRHINYFYRNEKD